MSPNNPAQKECHVVLVSDLKPRMPRKPNLELGAVAMAEQQLHLPKKEIGECRQHYKLTSLTTLLLDILRLSDSNMVSIQHGRRRALASAVLYLENR